MSGVFLDPPQVRHDQKIIDGPNRIRSEHWWRIELSDGARLALGQLLPELAVDEALRRRYVYDAERLRSLSIPGLCEVLEIGPQPDPRDPTAIAPWRLRCEPEGESLAKLFEQRAPFPPDEAIDLVARLADRVHEIHQRGLVLRDLEPRNIFVSADAIVLTEVGLARVDILSTRTASSLMLEGSPYAAPEHLRATVIDSRADLYTLGVILWEALTGSVPFTEVSAFFREKHSLPTLRSIGIEVPNGLDALIGLLLADKPSARPESARDVADSLRGETALTISAGKSVSLTAVVCQACGERLRPGLRLCLSCGKQAVQFSHASDDRKNGVLYEVRLVKLREDTESVAKLRDFFETVGEGPVPELNFIIGDARLYSRAERARLHKLPATLINNLDKSTALQLAARLKGEGFKIKVAASRAHFKKKPIRRFLYGGLTVALVGGIATGVASPIVGLPILAAGVVSFAIGFSRALRIPRGKTEPLALLRKTPAALPASDPLIARLARLLALKPAQDVRDRIAEMALLLQRLVDHRSRDVGAADASELERLIAPLEPVVLLIEQLVTHIAECDTGLCDLDEGTLIRAIARSEAAGDPRSVRLDFYAGLDRLRQLEDLRAHSMEQLLEASSLMRRISSLALGAKSEAAETKRLAALALSTL